MGFNRFWRYWQNEHADDTDNTKNVDCSVAFFVSAKVKHLQK